MTRYVHIRQSRVLFDVGSAETLLRGCQPGVDNTFAKVGHEICITLSCMISEPLAGINTRILGERELGLVVQSSSLLQNFCSYNCTALFLSMHSSLFTGHCLCFSINYSSFRRCC